MTLGNMRELGVRGLAVNCLNDARRRQTGIGVDFQRHDFSKP
jgi:hypothetical protein